MKLNTLHGNIKLFQNNNEIECDITFSDLFYYIQLAPKFSKLAYDTEYKIVVNNKIKDLSGNFLNLGNGVSEKEYVLKTEKELDKTSPIVIEKPTLTHNIITIRFSEDINPHVFNDDTISVIYNNTIVHGETYYHQDEKSIIFEPNDNLLYDNEYNITIQVQDLAGNIANAIYTNLIVPYVNPHVISFVVDSPYPAGGRAATIFITFNEVININSVTLGIIQLYSNSQKRSKAIDTDGISFSNANKTIYFVVNPKSDFSIIKICGGKFGIQFISEKTMEQDYIRKMLPIIK